MVALCMCLSCVSAFAQQPDKNLLPESALTPLACEVRELGLPVVIVDTENGIDPTCEPIAPPFGCMGNGITGNEYVKGRLCLVEGDDLLYDSGTYVKNESGMRTKVRGNSSAYTDFKSLKVKLEKKDDLLLRGDGRYADKDWVLLNIFSTRNLKSVLGFYLGRTVAGQWEPAWRFVNLMQNGKYRGIYMLAEPVERGEMRCQIGEEGYLIEADPYWWNEAGIVFRGNKLPYAMAYTFKYPDSDELTPEAVSRISGNVQHFEEELYEGGDIAEVIDVRSFVGWMLVHDILGSVDGCGSNIFLKKTDYDPQQVNATKLEMGPLWDFDSAFETHGKWAAAHEMQDFYFHKLFENKDFVEAYVSRWDEISDGLYDKSMREIRAFVARYGDAVNRSREFMWDTTPYPLPPIEEDVCEVESWMAERIPWMEQAVRKLDEETAIVGVEVNREPVELRVYGIDGTVHAVFTGHEGAKAWKDGLSGLGVLPGIYVLRATFADGIRQVRKQIVH